VLIRFPALLASLATGALLLALAAASYPLFISATASAALEKQIEAMTRLGSGLGIQSQASLTPIPGEPGIVESFRRRDRLARAALQHEDLAEPTLTALGGIVEARSDEPRRETDLVRLIYRTGFLEHVTVLEDSGREGAWVSELVARHLRVESGDRIWINDEDATKRIAVDIAGIYRDLYNEPQTPYWVPLLRYIYPSKTSPPPPAFLFLPPEQVLAHSRALAPEERQEGGIPAERAMLSWDAPLRVRDGLTLDDARAVQAFGDRIEQRFRTEPRYADVFCFRCFRDLPFVTTNVRGLVLQTERRVAPVEGPVRLVLVAGLLVAFAVIAGAGVFAVAARRTETGLLFARGMNPATVAFKTCVESLAPALLGAAAGLGLAVLLVFFWGPQGAVDRDAITDAARVAAIAVPASVLLLGVVSGVAFAHYSESTSERLSWFARVPWELAVLAAAGYFYKRLQSGGALVRDESIDVTRPGTSLLVFPILMMGGLGMLAARGLQGIVGAIRRHTRRVSAATYLMITRLAGAQRLAILLFAGSALSLGIFVHAQTIVSSLEHSVDAKAYLFVGSDVQAVMSPGTQVPADLPFPATKVTRLLDAGEVVPTGTTVDLLAIDPATFAAATYWDAEFGAPSVEVVTDHIEDDGGSTLRVAVANGELPDASAFTHAGGKTVPIDVVTSVTVFPGTASRAPLLIADAAAVERLMPVVGPVEDPRASTEFWGKGDPDVVADAFSTMDDQPYGVITAREVKDIPSISAAIDTFGVLNVLGLGAGLLVVVVILMYLQARQRARVVSFALSRRMGLSSSTHGRALAGELAILLLGSFVVGGALALVAALVIVGMIDPLAAIPPEPLFAPPIARFAVAAGVLGVIAVVGGIWTNRRAARARIAEVMRVAE